MKTTSEGMNMLCYSELLSVAKQLLKERDAVRESIAAWVEDPVAQNLRRAGGLRGMEGMALAIRAGAGVTK